MPCIMCYAANPLVDESDSIRMEGTLDEVSVTALSSRKKLDIPSLGLEKLTIQQIRLMPSMFGEVDVIKSLQMLPGVQSMSEGSSAFSVRGGAPDQNLILLDGATIYNASHFLGFFSIFNNDIIDNAVLHKGDMPATQGGRLSSVLEVTTKEGSNEKLHGQGGIGLISSRILLEGPLVKDKLTAWIGGRVFYAGMFLPALKNVNRLVSKSRLTFYDINAKLSATLSAKHRLYITGYAGGDYMALSGTGKFMYSNYSATARWSAIVSDKFYINTSFLSSFYNYTGSGSLNALSGQWTSKIDDYGFRQEYTYNPDVHNSLKMGYHLSYKYIKSGDTKINQEGIENSMGISIPATSSIETALFASNAQKYGIVSLTYGLRASFLNNIYWNLEPRAGIAVEFYKDMSLKASYSRTAQYIHLMQTSTAGSPLDVWKVSSPNLKPETCDQVSVGYVCNFYKDQFQISVEGYYKWLHNVADFKDFADVMLNKDVDAEILSGKGRAFGVEFMLRRDIGKVTGWVSYTYSRSFRTIDGINSGREYSSTADRPHSVNIFLNYKINKWIDVSATWVYATGQPFTAPDARYEVPDFGDKEVIPLYTGRNTYRMPDYHRLDLAVTFDLNKGIKKRYNHNINISLYNVYCRHNAWMMSFQTNPESHQQEAILTYLFSIVPSITYNLSF
ncbi:MAG: TonB-dependent receptor plug domain-containing protein [Paludibacteraceae bacterium]|nr:TonB-dependent receptor plug domain-containing protein [Paludibacteraceae bacterium]